MGFLKISEITPREVAPGFHGRFFHADHMTVAYWDAKAGATIPTHSHVHEMIVNVLQGRLELTIGEETRIIEPGVVGVIPGQMPHSARAITDCLIIDVFNPIREDYR